MADISLDSTPKSFDFSKNPIRFEISAPNRYETVGTNSVNKIKQNSSPSNGDYFTIEFLSFNLNFAFVTTPNNSGQQLTAGSTVATTVGELKLNYYLDKYFDITVSGLDTIVFTAKYNGTGYDMTYDFTNATTLQDGGSVGATDSVLRPNYKVFIQLMISAYNQADYSEYFEAFLIPDADGKVYYYPGRILQEAFDPPALPQYIGGAGISTWLSPLMDYKIRYAEVYGVNESIKILNESSEFSLIDGMLHSDKWPTHDFFNDLATSKQFLTNRPEQIDIWREAHDFLFFLNWATNKISITVYFDLYFDDGTSAAKAHSISSTEIESHEIYCIPIGLYGHGLESLYEDKVIQYYTVYVEQNSTLISEVKEFHVTNRPLNSIELLYKNNYGCLDSLLCSNTKIQFKHDSVFVQKDLPSDYDLKDTINGTEVKDQYMTFSTYTGYLKPEEAYILSEMYQNNHVFLVSRSKFIKVELLSDAPTLIDKKDNVQNFEIKFRLSVNGTLSYAQIL